MKMQDVEIVVAERLTSLTSMTLDTAVGDLVLHIDEGNLCICPAEGDEPVVLCNPAEVEEFATALHHMALAYEHGFKQPQAAHRENVVVP